VLINSAIGDLTTVRPEPRLRGERGVCVCDLVALRGDEPPLIVIDEVKLDFNLELDLQGINRMQ